MNSICFVNNAYIKITIGGAEVQMYLLAKAFHANGWKVYYASEDIDVSTIDEGLNLVPLKNSKKKSFDYAFFCSVLNKIDADIYYQRGRKTLTYYLSKYCRQYDKKFIYATSMDIDTKRFKQASRLSIKKTVQYVKSIIPALIQDKKSLMGIKMANLVLAQTEDQKQAYRVYRGVDSVVIKKIYPIENKTFSKSHPPIILWVANIKSWKQPELFIKLADDLKTHNCSFIMAGDLRENKILPIIQSCTNERFSYVGRVSFFESGQLFQKSSVFVNTSYNYESEPNTYVESWLNEVPVVALNHDPDDVIKTKQLGFHSGSYEQLVKDVKKLIDDPNLRIQMGKRAKQYAHETYSSKNFEDLLKLINKVLSR